MSTTLAALGSNELREVKGIIPARRVSAFTVFCKRRYRDKRWRRYR
jgi:hypothetical protein